MNKKILLMTLISFAFFANTSFSQIREIPEAVEDAFSEQYDGAVNVDYKDQLAWVYVSFELNGEKMTATYNNKGTWKETVKDWTFDKLPPEVKDGFEKSKYADREVEETKIIYLSRGSEQYRLKTRKNDVEKKYLYFNTKGRLLKEAITL
jgi:Putative beta-lactamase-inhibitor-like, PepSY-like